MLIKYLEPGAEEPLFQANVVNTVTYVLNTKLPSFEGDPCNSFSIVKCNPIRYSQVSYHIQMSAGHKSANLIQLTGTCPTPI